MKYHDETIRAYLCTYERNYYGIPRLAYFGEEDPGNPGEYRWRYGFVYGEPEKDSRGQLLFFDDPREWEMDNGLQVQYGVSGGMEGSVSSGVGFGIYFWPEDRRVAGGIRGGMSGGRAQARQTLVDINGDGRPDSVRKTVKGIGVALNNGIDGFDREHDYEIDVDSLEAEENSLVTYGWNVFGGKSMLPFIGSVGAVYAETHQNGWSDLTTGFADIDGDGLVDLAVKGSGEYYRNTSSEAGIGFQKTRLYQTTGQAIEDVEIALDPEEREGYARTYYQQSPFRSWRSPFGGRVAVTQHVTAAAEPLSEDGIQAKTYMGDELVAGYDVGGGVWTPESGFVYDMAAGQSLYFVGDAGWDTRGDDLDWDITVRYEELAYFEGMDRGDVCLPPGELGAEALAATDLLYPLYLPVFRESWPDPPSIEKYVLRDEPWTDCIEGRYAGEPVQVIAWRVREAWEEMVRRGWYVPGRLDGAGFAALLDRAALLDGQAGTASWTCREVTAAYYSYDAGAGCFTINTRNKAAVAEEVWHGYETLLRDLVMGCPEETRRALGAYFWIDGTPVWPVADAEGRVSYFHMEEAALDGGQEGQPGIIRRGEGGLRLSLGVLDGDVWTIDMTDGEVYQNDLPRGTGEIIDETEGITVRIPAVSAGKTLYEREYWFADFAEVAEYASREELEAVRVELQEAEYSEERWQRFMEEDFPFYEEPEEGDTYYRLKAGAVTAGEDLARYRQFIYGTYTGAYRRSIRYYADGVHPVEGNGIKVPELAEGFHMRQVTRERVAWNSGEDFSTENLVTGPVVYETDPVVYETGETGGEGYVSARRVETVEGLYGGVNRWYYGVWFGDQEGIPFSGSALEEQRFGGTDRAGYAETEAAVTAGSDAVKAAGNGEPPAAGTLRQDAGGGFVCGEVRANRNDGEPAAILGDSELEERGFDAVVGDALVGAVSTRLKSGIDGNGEPVQTVETFAPFIRGNYIHANRTGGAVFYEIRGVRGGTLGVDTGAVSGGAVPMRMISLRKSDNKGMDTVAGPKTGVAGDVIGLAGSLSLITGTAAGMDQDSTRERIKQVFYALGLPKSSNSNTSRMTQTVQDINGDGVADILKSGGGSVTVIPGSRQGFGTPYTIDGGGYLSFSETESYASGGSPNALGSIMNGVKSNGRNAAASVNGTTPDFEIGLGASGGITYSDGTSRQLAGLVDINGDGLPDYLTGGAAGISTGERFETRTSFGGISVNTSETTSIGGAFSLHYGLGITSAEAWGGGFSVGGSLSYSVSASQTTAMLLDINGDGLPDKVSKGFGSDAFTVCFNQGNRFGDPVPVRADGWSLSADEYIAFQAVTDGNIMTAALTGLPVIENAAEDIGLSGAFDAVDDRGIIFNPFGFILNNYINSLSLNTTMTLGASGSGQGCVMISIPIPLPVPPYVAPLFNRAVNVSIASSAGINAGANLSGVSVQTMDINGDGLPDRVLRIPGSDRIYVRKNLLGEAGLLKRIDFPQGGSCDLSYAWKPGTTAMPRSRYVLAEVTRHDGNGEPGYQDLDYGEHAYTVRYGYEDGYYDREVKEFYGFATVTELYADGSRKETAWHTRDYYRKGMKHTESIRNAEGFVLRFTGYDTDNAPYARIRGEYHREYETDQAGDPAERRVAYGYDGYGNVTEVEETVSTGETMRVVIGYWHDSGAYLHAHPAEITVYDGGNRPVRRRRGFYTDRGSLARLEQYDGNGWNATLLSWDGWGNLSRVEDPGGAWTGYGYDDELHQYVERLGGDGVRPERAERQSGAERLCGRDGGGSGIGLRRTRGPATAGGNRIRRA